MAIKPNVYTSTRRVVPVSKLAATATTQYTVGAFDSTGKLIPAVTASTTAEVQGIILQTKTAGDAAVTVEVEEINPDFEYVADTVNNSNAAHNGNKMLLATAGTVTNSATDEALGQVVQVGVVGVASDKKILVKFIK